MFSLEVHTYFALKQLCQTMVHLVKICKNTIYYYILYWIIFYYCVCCINNKLERCKQNKLYCKTTWLPCYIECNNEFNIYFKISTYPITRWYLFVLTCILLILEQQLHAFEMMYDAINQSINQLTMQSFLQNFNIWRKATQTKSLLVYS